MLEIENVKYTIWLFNIAMETCPFIDGLPIKDAGSFHGELLNNQMVVSLDWFKGKSAGNHGFYHQIGWAFL